MGLPAKRAVKGPQMLTGQGSAERIAERREAPLRREGRPRTMRGATEGPVEVGLDGGPALGAPGLLDHRAGVSR